MLVDSTGCDAVELRVVKKNKLVFCEISPVSQPAARAEVRAGKSGENGVMIPCLEHESDLEIICEEITHGRIDPSLPFFTAKGSFVTGDATRPVVLSSRTCKWAGGRTLDIAGEYRSLAVIPFLVDDKDRCLLLLKSGHRDYFTASRMELFEELAHILGIALGQMRAQIALRERVKELLCLYGIAQVAARPNVSLDDILAATVQLLPPGWLYPHIASARIVYGEVVYATAGFGAGVQKQTAPIVVSGVRCGIVEVEYSALMPELDEGPFLKEERDLINAIAGELALIIERKKAEEDKEKLQGQLLHADRLATIGQLAAGVAHELNEPLGSILGFAQLIEKEGTLSEQVRRDIDKIIKASLHARGVINKLMLFARQTPARRECVDLNRMVQDGLYFLEARCAKAGVELVRVLAPDLPPLTADAGQLLQVVVNLVVNAIQAMPHGGQLTLRTAREGSVIVLTVEDTGVGMSEEILNQVFVPFFTTKDVNEGTGLGLAVVQGIVSSHGGSIQVESAVGQGTCFEVRLPLDSPGQPTKQGEA